jgi:magnesium transporter
VTENESLPWELRAFELFLEEAVWRLEDDFTALEDKVKGAIALIQSTTRGGLGAMHRAKRALLLYVARAQDMHNVLENVLSDPEDLAAMHLTDRRLFECNRKIMGQTDSFQSWKAGGGGGASIEDLEMMIETYSDTALNLLRAGQQLEEEVKDTEELVSLQLDTQRNQILGVEMIITIVSTCFALGAFVSGLDQLCCAIFDPIC